MFLLNRTFKEAQLYLPHIFTFHYVSIKSGCLQSDLSLTYTNLHSTMFLLNPGISADAIQQSFNLHSTMFLLNPRSAACFTIVLSNLHSTMFLLNLTRNGTIINKRTDLHSTMFLLNRYKILTCLLDIVIYIPLCFY